MFKRKIYSKIKEWKSSSDGKTALLIEGARRVGKSTVVEEFAKNEYATYILIDFSTASNTIKELFEDMSDLNYFFLQLQLQYHVELETRKSVIIFDEVQLCPKARQAIKALVKDGRYDYIETGSLISIKKNVKDILIPSEERKLQMHPMDYEEFLWALGDSTTMKLLKGVFESKKSFGDQLNRKLLRDFRLYMLVGGMPQAVHEFITTNNFKKVDDVKRDIINLYEDDFRKIDSTGRLAMLFEAIPSQLNKNAKGFQTKKVLNSYKTTDTTILSLVSELKDSKVVSVAYHANNPDIGLSAYKDLNQFKLYMADTGLFVTLQFKDKDFTENIIYEKLLNDKLATNLGYLYENAVAQILTATGNDLFYYTFYQQEQKRNYEIDFVISKRNKICPIEVKSSRYKVHASLDVFYEKFSDRILNRYIIHTKDVSKDKDILCLPIYLTQFISQKEEN
ncbi:MULTISPECIES: ATP-binding protein [Bacillota]|jgi:predicted AAA+ superfamily ATPase|uniref:ATP-binding protein n=2 Tax=Erysipelotrichaceae TaxID=128827 RepID=A0A7G9GIH0_9FIRM|nr:MULTISPECIES: AAA family ATPase [Bacillota]MCR0451240.1 AAA family ATPase [[Clostridium] innocuum]QNM10602.1 ATP-binding protein [[Eubacterium] hominis]MCR0473055.1 AAA family ATPase [[Clostridium] innocuum]RGB54061.1 ATP-binding protein [Absiella sp. AM22-9]RGB61141.1 ATP-binding protein [Absiella sp. AM10-20]